MLEKLPGAVGKVLYNQRAGFDEIAFEILHGRPGIGSIEVSSPAFDDNQPIPPRYTADGDGISPPLEWSGVPANADSLALIVEKCRRQGLMRNRLPSAPTATLK